MVSTQVKIKYIINKTKKLNKILSDTNKLKEVQMKGLNHIKLKYDWLEIGKETKRSYQSIL